MKLGGGRTGARSWPRCPVLTGEAARRLRMGLPLAEGGGRVLADWITRLDAESKQEG